MSNIIQVKRSNVPLKIPTPAQLGAGEFAVNTADRVAYFGTGTTVEKIGTAPSNELLFYSLTGADSNLSEIMAFLSDSSRSDKILSLESTTYDYSEANFNANDWMRIAEAVDELSGYVMPYDGTIVRMTGHCSDCNSNTLGIEVHINNTNAGVVGTFSGAEEATFTASDVNIDFSAGDKIRLRGESTGGLIQDTVISFWVKWRYV